MASKGVARGSVFRGVDEWRDCVSSECAMTYKRDDDDGHLIWHTDRALEEERAAWMELHLAAREVVMHMGKRGILARLDRAVARVKELLP